MSHLKLWTLASLALCLGVLSAVAQDVSFAGCFPELPPADDLYFHGYTTGFGEGTAPVCAQICFDRGYVYSTASENVPICQCFSTIIPDDFPRSDECPSGCGYEPPFLYCSAGLDEGRAEAIYFTGVPLPVVFEQIMVIGGDKKASSDNIFIGSLASGDCTAIPNAPFDTHRSIALRDKDGRPIVCGGTKGKKDCTIYDVTTNTWVEGPSLKRERIGSSAVCLKNLVCWIFGGISREHTEYYDPETHSFVVGPDMPINSVHGICAALAPSGLIYFVGKREPGKTRAFTFDPSSLAFTDIGDIDGVEIRYPACAVVDDPSNPGDVLFVVVGGSLISLIGTSNVRIFNSKAGVWNSGPKYPRQIFGASAGQISSSTFTVQGGLTPLQGEITDIYTFDPETMSWCKQARRLSKGRSFAPSIGVKKACPSA